MNETLIAVFRHGHTCYRQGNGEVSVYYADDLCMPSEPDPLWGRIISESQVRFSTGSLLQYLEEKVPTRITCSPAGRTIATGKCIYRRLFPYGITFPCRPNPWAVEIDPKLREVEGFNWGLYSALVNGGSIKDPYPCVLNREDTNPYGFDDTDYFFSSIMYRLPLRKVLPQQVFAAIEAMETPLSCIQRFRMALHSAASDVSTRQWIFVTHAGITEWPVRVFTRNKLKDLPRGSWILIRVTPDSANVVAMRGVVEGDSETDLMTSNWLDYQPKIA